MKRKITFIGLGVMGYPMAGHLSKNEYDVCVYNRDKTKSEKWKNEYRGSVAVNISEAVRDSDVILTCVGEDKDLKEVYEGDDGILGSIKSGSTIIDHTTASANIAKYFHKKCSSLNVGFLDAPVSGGQIGAQKGTLSIMVGGNSNNFINIKEILSCYGKNISLIGESGSGQLCKMVNQICIAGLVQALSEALIFGKKSNLNMEKVIDVISSGAAQSWQMENRANTMIKNEFNFGFAVDWMCKDLKICFEQSNDINAELPITKIIYDYYKKVKSNGGGRWDTSSLISLLN